MKMILTILLMIPVMFFVVCMVLIVYRTYRDTKGGE